MANIKESNKLEFHPTPDALINDMFDILKENYKGEITEYLETSAGSGAIIKHFDKPYIAFEIDERFEREDIKICNYLKEKIEYKEGRVAMINPPFSSGLKHLYKALEDADYCVAIMSANSLLNIQYDKIWLDHISFYKRYPFKDCKVSIILVGARKKREGIDFYEYE